MFKYAIGVLLGVLLFIAGIVVWRTGVLKEVNIASANYGPYLLVYREHLGPYHEIAPMITDIENKVKGSNLPCPLAFGRYIDDPNTVDHDRLRSQGGCALPVKVDHPWQEMDLKTMELPAREYVVATFNGSPSVGPFKVYPKVVSWMKKYGYEVDGPIIELYKTLPDETVLTTYLFPYK